MPPVSYESLQSDIDKQQSQIVTQRETIQQQKIVGGKSIQSLRRVHPRTPPSQYFGVIKPQLEQVKSRITKLESAEKELTVAEQQLSEQEQLLQKRKAEGYKVRETAEGQVQFFKPAPPKPTSRYGSVERTETHEGKTIAIHYSSGVVVYPQHHMIKIPGEPFQKLPSHPELQPVMLDRHTSVERHLVDWYRWKTEQEKVEVPGETITTTRKLTQVEITNLLSKMTKTEKIAWYKKNAEFGAEGEVKKSWSEIKKEHPDWKLSVVGTEAKILTPEKDEATLFEVMEKEYLKSPGVAGVVRAGAIGFLSAFRFETIVEGLKQGGPLSGGGVLGVQPKIGRAAAVETLRWEYSIKDQPPLEKFIGVQIPAYETAIVPFVGGAVVGKAGKLYSGASKIWSPGTKIVIGGTKIVVAGAVSTIIGADIGYTAAMEQAERVRSGTLAAKLGKYTTQIAFFGLGAKWVTTPKHVGVREVGKDTLEFQKFVTKLGKKPLIKYGESTILDRAPGGFRKVVPTKTIMAKAAKSRFEVVGKVMKDPFVKPVAQPLKVTSLNMDVAYAEVARYGVSGVTPTVAGKPPGMPSALVVRTGALVPRLFTDIQLYDIVSPIKGRIDYGLKPLSKIELERLNVFTEVKPEASLKQIDNIFKTPFKQPKQKVQTLRIESIDTKLGYGRIAKYGVTSTVATLPKPEGIELMNMERYIDWIEKKEWLRGTYEGAKKGPLGTFIPGVGKGMIEIHPKLFGRFKGRTFDITLRHELIHFHEITGVSEKHLPYEQRPSEIFAYKYEKTDFPFIKKTPEWLKPESKLQYRLRETYPEYVEGALVIRKEGKLIPLDVGKVSYGYFKPDIKLQYKQVGRIALEPKSRIEIERERELKRVWEEGKQKKYDDDLKRMSEKFRVTFKPRKPKVETLRVEEMGEGYARVFKYGVKGVTPTVVGKPPKPGPGIYTGRQPIIRPISDLTIWDWLTRQPIRPEVVKEPLFKIFNIKMKPLRYTLKDIIKEPKIEPTDTITRDGQILKTVTKVKTEPPLFRPRFARPEPVYDPLSTYGEYEYIRNDVVENFGRLTGMQKPRGKIQPVSFRPNVVKYFPTVLDVRKKVKPDVDVNIKTSLDRDVTSMQQQFPISKTGMDVILDIGKVYDTSQMQEQGEMQRFDYRTDMLSIEDTATMQVQAMDVASMQRLRTEQITKQVKTKKVMGGLPDTTYKLFGHTRGQGYNVKIKERHYVKGKKIKEGRFIKINKKPLSLEDATSLKFMLLDNSAAASGKIVPTNKMAQQPVIELTHYSELEHKFYIKEVKGKKVHIEKNTYRIDTKGEVKGISALGWYAEKSKKAERKRQIVADKQGAKKVRQVDMFDMGMPDMLINMDKIFKGAFNGF